MSQVSKKSAYTNAAFCQQSEFFDSRCKSPRRQSPVGAQTVHILDTSIRSIQEEPLPPRPPTLEDSYEEEQEFYEEMIVDDRGAVKQKKFVVLHQQNNPGRYDYIPMRPNTPQEVYQRREKLASPPKVLYHEEVDASTGRLHRYATIPSDDELEEIDSPQDHNTSTNTVLSQSNKQYALVPVEELKNKSRYAVITQEDIAASQSPPPPIQRQVRQVQTPERLREREVVSPHQQQKQLQQKSVVPSPRRPAPNPAATQKLHEYIITPKKRLQPSMTPISPIQPTRTPLRPISAPRAQQKLNYTLGTRQMQPLDKRHTAIVSPICSSPVQAVYHETTFSTKAEESSQEIKKSPQKSIAIAAFMMILCGCVTTGLCIYMISYLGRNYYLDFGILSGFICFLLGLLGFRSRHIYWLPNRNYLSGYFVLSVFSLLTCSALLVLLVTQPKPGTLLADMTSGAVCGISALSLALAAIGVLASYCCNVPPPDNRVEHCAPGFNV